MITRLRIAQWIGRVGPCGLSPVAPGTAGSLAALLAFRALGPQSWWVHVAIALVLFAAGTWACQVAEKAPGAGHDASELCIDEVVGQWMTSAVAPFTWPWLLLSFALFRVMDIVKPWPVSVLDRRVTGGLGVMVDDVGAGAYAILVLWALQQAPWVVQRMAF